jgi:glycosyltransferase involved in cell wall biosynthesis
MSEQVKISIITPSYNQGQFIEETILSVLNQTYKNIEYILIDGESTDNTLEIINRYKDKIDVVISEKDKGQSDAINKGFRLSTGKLVGWINSDDILYPDCVEKIARLYAENPDGSIYYSASIDLIDKEGKVLSQRVQKIAGKDYLLNKNYEVLQQGSFYETNCLKRVGYVDENIYFGMDLDLWLRLLDFGKVYYSEGSSLSAFRIWEDTKTSQAGTLFLKDVERIINKYGAKKFSRTKIKLFYIYCRIQGGKVKRFIMGKSRKNYQLKI